MLRLIILLPFLVLLVAFVASGENQNVVTMALPYIFSVRSTAGAAVLVAAVVFFLLGLLMAWFAELRQRRRARRAEQQVRGLEAQLAELRGQLAQSVAHNVVHAGTAPSGNAAAPAALPPLSY